MPLFRKDSFGTPFGRNVYLRSTQDVKTTSYMVAGGSVPAATVDGFAGQKVLQPGTVMAKITSGGDSGKIGPFSAAATDGRQTAANIVGICNTFLPWQLMEGDREIAVVYEAAVYQARCIEYDAGSLPVALGDATAASMLSTKTLRIIFH